MEYFFHFFQQGESADKYNIIGASVSVSVLLILSMIPAGMAVARLLDQNAAGGNELKNDLPLVLSFATFQLFFVNLTSLLLFQAYSPSPSSTESSTVQDNSSSEGGFFQSFMGGKVSFSLENKCDCNFWSILQVITCFLCNSSPKIAIFLVRIYMLSWIQYELLACLSARFFSTFFHPTL